MEINEYLMQWSDDWHQDHDDGHKIRSFVKYLVRENIVFDRYDREQHILSQIEELNRQSNNEYLLASDSYASRDDEDMLHIEYIDRVKDDTGQVFDFDRQETLRWMANFVEQDTRHFVEHLAIKALTTGVSNKKIDEDRFLELTEDAGEVWLDAWRHHGFFDSWNKMRESQRQEIEQWRRGKQLPEGIEIHNKTRGE